MLTAGILLLLTDYSCQEMQELRVQGHMVSIVASLDFQHINLLTPGLLAFPS